MAYGCKHPKLEWVACPLVSDYAVLNFEGVAVARRFVGCQVSLDGSFAAETSRRVSGAWAMFWRCRPWLLNRSCSRNERVRLWRLMLDSNMMWVAVHWIFKDVDLNKIKTMELAMCRKIAMHPRGYGEDVWNYWTRTASLFRRWCNVQGTLPLVGRASLRKWRWQGI